MLLDACHEVHGFMDCGRPSSIGTSKPAGRRCAQVGSTDQPIVSRLRQRITLKFAIGLHYAVLGLSLLGCPAEVQECSIGTFMIRHSTST